MRKENKHRIVVYVSDDIYSLLEKEDEPNRSKFIEDVNGNLNLKKKCNH